MMERVKMEFRRVKYVGMAALHNPTNRPKKPHLLNLHYASFPPLPFNKHAHINIYSILCIVSLSLCYK